MKVVLINLPTDTKLLDSRGEDITIFGNKCMLRVLRTCQTRVRTEMDLHRMASRRKKRLPDRRFPYVSKYTSRCCVWAMLNQTPLPLVSHSGRRRTGEGHLWESKFYIPFQPQKWASNKSNNLMTSSCASCGAVWSHKAGTLSTLSPL